MLRSAQRGFSLTELMIGSALGLFVIAGALQLYAANVRAAADTLRVSRLNQELRAALQLLGNELRRAGYWAGEPGIDPHAGNPFQSAANDIRIGRLDGETTASCLLYAYDRNGDKRVGIGPSGLPGPHESAANLEQFGVRLRAGLHGRVLYFVCARLSDEQRRVHLGADRLQSNERLRRPRNVHERRLCLQP